MFSDDNTCVEGVSFDVYLHTLQDIASATQIFIQNVCNVVIKIPCPYRPDDIVITAVFRSIMCFEHTCITLQFVRATGFVVALDTFGTLYTKKAQGKMEK